MFRRWVGARRFELGRLERGRFVVSMADLLAATGAEQHGDRRRRHCVCRLATPRVCAGDLAELARPGHARPARGLCGHRRHESERPIGHPRGRLRRSAARFGGPAPPDCDTRSRLGYDPRRLCRAGPGLRTQSRVTAPRRWATRGELGGPRPGHRDLHRAASRRRSGRCGRDKPGRPVRGKVRRPAVRRRSAGPVSRRAAGRPRRWRHDRDAHGRTLRRRNGRPLRRCPVHRCEDRRCGQRRGRRRDDCDCRLARRVPWTWS